MTSKTCTGCRETKELNAYHRNKSRSDGRSHRCKSCVKAYQAEWRERPEVQAHKAEWTTEYESRPEVKEHRAKYRARPEVKARQAEYEARAETKARRAEYGAEHKANHPHIGWESYYRQRARAYGFDYLIPSLQSFTREDLIWLHGDRCYHCGGDWDQLDHWPLAISQGGMHALFNAVPSCANCNQRSWRTTQLTTTTDKDN